LREVLLLRLAPFGAAGAGDDGGRKDIWKRKKKGMGKLDSDGQPMISAAADALDRDPGYTHPPQFSLGTAGAGAGAAAAPAGKNKVEKK